MWEFITATDYKTDAVVDEFEVRVHVCGVRVNDVRCCAAYCVQSDRVREDHMEQTPSHSARTRVLCRTCDTMCVV
jgi:hypothetical protein